MLFMRACVVGASLMLAACLEHNPGFVDDAAIARSDRATRDSAGRDQLRVDRGQPDKRAPDSRPKDVGVKKDLKPVPDTLARDTTVVKVDQRPPDTGVVGDGSVACGPGLLKCKVGYFCELPSCGAGTGQCVPVPTVCSNTLAPQCGCDGVTYFNSCLRQQAQTSVHSPGSCGIAQLKVCGGTLGGCGPGQTCIFLYDQKTFCNTTVGSCWALPATCPGFSVLRFRPCQGPNQCLGLCQAGKTGQAYFLDNTCP